MIESQSRVLHLKTYFIHESDKYNWTKK